MISNTQPHICAVIALYNGEKFIERALLSVLDQSLPAREVIVVDDGSTDRGADIVRKIAEGRPNVRLLSKVNGGQSSARNLAARSTTADFLAFLDQDDEWYPDHLERLHAPFEHDMHGRIGFVYANLDEVDVNGRMVNFDFLRQLPTSHPKKSIIDCLRQDMFVLPGASLTRRGVFDEVGGFDEALIGYEDDDLFLRIFEQGYRNVFVDETVTRWRIHLGSTSYSSKMQRSRMIYARKLMAKYPNDPTFHRHFTRDLIIPRFIGTIKAEYLGALKDAQRDQAIALAADLRELAAQLGVYARLRLIPLLLLARARRLTRALFAIGPHLPSRVKRIAVALS